MSTIDPTHSQKRIAKSEAVAENGMVTTMHPLAAEAGVEILRSGGNAADAAVATALAISVVEPFMSGLGGCAYAVSYDAKRATTSCYEGSARAPQKSHEAMFDLVGADLKSDGLYGWRATVDDAAETGHRAVAVPGTVAALAMLHEAEGKKPWKELFAPAIRLAEGVPVDEYFFTQSAASAARLKAFDHTMAIFFEPDGTPKVPGAAGGLRQEELARTFAVVAEEGPQSFYTGSLASAIVDGVRAGGGILSLDDLAQYKARRFDPLWVRYRDATIATLPENSGGPTLAFALSLLDGFDLASLPYDAVSRLHLIAEALRMAFTDRYRYLGDSELLAIPFEGLSSDEYLAERRKLMTAEGHRLETVPEGDPWRYDSKSPSSLRGSGESTSQQTTHLNVIDAGGNMVALTGTLGARFGSGVTAPELGVVLNNGMMWFDPEPGHKSSVSPGKRALHAAAPCLLFDGEARRAAVGSPGGRKIMSAVLQVLLAMLDHGMGPKDAVAAPRIHCESAPTLLVETGFSSDVADGLRARGHDITFASEGFIATNFGRPSAIVLDHARHELRGGVEPYRVSAAIGY